MTDPKSLSRDQVLALRGLRLPFVALKGLRRAGIYCQPAVSIEFRHDSHDYVIRGVESGGAIAQIGAYCTFVDETGSSLPVFETVHTIGVNGLHGTVFSPRLVRVQMFRAGANYELLLTRHALMQLEGKARPRLQNSILFHAKHGKLEMELWRTERAQRGMVVPVFYRRNGEQVTFPEQFHEAVLRVTAGACCVGCRHNHLLTSGTAQTPRKTDAS